MTREEEIIQEAYQKYPYIGGTKGMICESSIPIFIQGAEWADKTMIDKACKWLKGQEEMIGISFEEDFIERFKEAMEE